MHSFICKAPDDAESDSALATAQDRQVRGACSHVLRRLWQRNKCEQRGAEAVTIESRAPRASQVLQIRAEGAHSKRRNELVPGLSQGLSSASGVGNVSLVSAYLCHHAADTKKGQNSVTHGLFAGVGRGGCSAKGSS